MSVVNAPPISASLAAPTVDEDFYARLPTFRDLARLTDPGLFHDAPDGWNVVVTDIVDSTEAIKAGRYKDVNVVGALCIVGVLNATRGMDIPYAFGGDGALLLIPDTVRPEVEDALIDTKRIAREEFHLDLRIGLVPIADIHARGELLQVARWEVSPQYIQALFLGSGMARAERLVKDPLTASTYEIARTNGLFKADYTGFSCRWKPIPSPHDESVTLLVEQRGRDRDAARLYARVLAEIDAIYGDAQHRHPVTAKALRPAFSEKDLGPEAHVRFPDSRGGLPSDRRSHLWGVRFQVAVTNLWTLLGTRTNAVKTRQWFPRADPEMPEMDWGKYKDFLVETSDTQKLDGALRIVMSGSVKQRTRLEVFLEAEYQAGRLTYGLHVSKGALMTCLVFQPNGRQVHFIDGADGGYAFAARALKERAAALPPT